MKNRCQKIVLEAESGIVFEVEEGEAGTLIIRAKTSNYSEDYVKPPVPTGYKHVLGNWNDGFVIERILDGSQFVWIPVGYLDSDGTIDGENFVEKFGRRNYQNDEFSDDEFRETLGNQLLKQLGSVKKYGGFYISRYNISKDENGNPQSQKGKMPWVNISFNEARKVAASMEDTEEVKSHLTFGAEYDSVLEWLIKSGAKTLEEIKQDSSKWGNYSDTTWIGPRKILVTGKKEQWQANQIFDFAGNVEEWTNERRGEVSRVIRGGSYISNGSQHCAAYRDSDAPDRSFDVTGFRVALYIK